MKRRKVGGGHWPSAFIDLLRFADVQCTPLHRKMMITEKSGRLLAAAFLHIFCQFRLA